MTVRKVPVDSLRPHPLNEKLYPVEEEEDRELQESIDRYGILDRLVATPNGTIVHGVRRWRIAKKIGMEEVECEFREFEDPEIAVIEFNRYRKKTPRIIKNEYDFIRQKLAPKAKERQLAQLKPFKDSFVKTDKTEAEERVHVREQAAEKLGVSSGQLYMIDYIYSHEDEAKDIVEKLDRGEISVHQAYNKMKSRIEKPVELEEEESEGWKCPVCHNEYLVEKPVTLKICPYCDMEFQAWKAAKDYEKQVATMG